MHFFCGSGCGVLMVWTMRREVRELEEFCTLF